MFAERVGSVLRISVKDPLFPFPWNPNPSFYLKTPRSFCLAFSVALSFGSLRADDIGLDDPQPIVFDSLTLQAVTNLARSVSGVNASQATVDQNVESILQLLQSFTISQGGYNGWRSFPVGYTSGSYYSLAHMLGNQLVDGTFVAQDAQSSSRGFLYEIQRALYGRSGVPSANDALVPTLLRIEEVIPSTTNLEDIALSILGDTFSISSDASSIFASVANIESSTHWMTYTPNYELNVHDEDLLSALEGYRTEWNAGHKDYSPLLSNQVARIDFVLSSLQRLEYGVSQLVDHVEQMQEADSTSESMKTQQEGDTEDFIDTYEQEREDLENEDLPTATGDYTPSINPSDDQWSDLGLDQPLPNSHSALITLVPHRRSGSYNPATLPAVEVDLGRDPIASEVPKLKTFFEYLWGLLFGLLLTVKGVSMFRKCRLLTIQTGLDANQINVHLSYDPF